MPALAALAKRTWSDAFGDSVRPEDEETELDEGRSEAYFVDALVEETILVAEQGGDLVGYVQFGDVRIPEVDALPGDRGLHRLYVETALHGRGLGRALLEHALAHPRLAAGVLARGPSSRRCPDAPFPPLFAAHAGSRCDPPGCVLSLPGWCQQQI